MDNLYDLLQLIREKPGMYLGRPSIEALYMFLTGYNFARRQLNVPLSEQEIAFQHFQPWLQRYYAIKTSQSWSGIIQAQTANEVEAFKRFFELLTLFVEGEYALFVQGEIVDATR